MCQSGSTIAGPAESIAIRKTPNHPVLVNPGIGGMRVHTGLGGMVHVLAGSLGVSAVVLASAELFTALKLIGAAYLVWIGFRTI